MVGIFTTNAPANAQSLYSAPGSDSEQNLHIDKDGNVSMRQVKIYQIAGTTFYARYYIGLAFIRMIIKTDADTKIRRRFGDEISLKEVAPGDIVNVLGKIETGADSLSVVANDITNFSNQKKITSFTGAITEIGTSSASFILKTKGQDVITLTTGTSTQIRKGNRIIPVKLVHVGDTVIDASGTYDQATKNLDAKVVVIFTDMKVFEKRNFQGILKAMTEGNPPTLLINTEGKDYAVILSNNTLILNKKRQAVSIRRFLPGDTVRLYGAIREAEEAIIDAQIVRDIDL